jgi:hypothetical protein
VVQAGAPLVEIGDPLNLEVVADLLSTDATQIEKGAAVRIDGRGETALQVTRVDPAGFLKASALAIEEQRVRVTICDGGVRDARVREVRSRTDAAESTVLRLQQRAATERRPSSDVVDPRPAQKIGRRPDDRHSEAANDVASSVAGHSTLDDIDAASPAAGGRR